MSKRDQLGAGSSFGQTHAISARRTAINAVTAAPTEGAPPPIKLPVNVISLNPDNPRSKLGDLSQLGASLRDHGQKTAISIMGRFAYLEGNPGRQDDLEADTKYVVIDGNSRLAAAREVGLSEIKVMVDDGLGSNPDEILESALVANIHRQELDHLDEAKALEQLLKVHGTQEALAGRLHRSQGWVSQRLALLGLTPELKTKLNSGEESAAMLRLVGKKKPDEQAAHLQRLKAQRRQEQAEKKARAGERKAHGKRASASPKPHAPDGIEPAPGLGYYGVMKKDAEPAVGRGGGTESVPSPRGEGSSDQLPTLEPQVLFTLIIEQLDVPARRHLTELLVDYKIEETKQMRAAERAAEAK
ncbi:ParB/RepB/Spo0J family partition protein [Streptomyces sp. NPDC087901]|uniref:ParB/RepB/Spo0J family partition protein n=1 Tax=Streptomyces sp. NPDC087901 TaxID=3365818 RepID=UPI00380C8AD9